MSISGIGHKANLKEWADYAKNNSYMRDKAAVKTSLGTEGCDRDIVEGMPDPPREKREEGRGWADMDSVTASHTYTGDKGSKRGSRWQTKEPD